VSATKLAKRQAKAHGQMRPQYYVDYWHLSKSLDRRGPDYVVIQNLTRSNPFSVRATVQQLERYGYIQEGIDLFLLAESERPQINVAYERALLHAQLGQYELQYLAYLQALQQNRGYLATIEAKIAQNLSFDESGIHSQTIKKVLLDALKRGANPLFEQLYLFVLRQEGNFAQAITYLKASSKQGPLAVEPLIEIAQECVELGEHPLAQDALEFLLSNAQELRYVGRLEYVLVQLAQSYVASNLNDEFQQLSSQYPMGSQRGVFQWELYRESQQFKGLPKSPETLSAYSKNLALLRDMYPAGKQRGLVYLAEADAKRSYGQFDEALMDYARAEQLLGDSEEGDQARLEKALCALYRGDITWAKTQLEVLLKSTSKTIANDAMEYALLISANTVEDTLMEGLQLMKEALLLEAQWEYSQALVQYESLLNILIAHELYDDLLLRLGRLHAQLGQYAQAREYFIQLEAVSKGGMWLEEGIYFAAKMSALLKSESAAMELEDYLVEYPNGLYTEEARQFYRTFTP
jgi:tetratricopeptide (TPR) repeat protein